MAQIMPRCVTFIAGTRARASLANTPEGPRFAEWIARFFEQA
jgi:hypothetical protein